MLYMGKDKFENEVGAPCAAGCGVPSPIAARQVLA